MSKPLGTIRARDQNVAAIAEANRRGMRPVGCYGRLRRNQELFCYTRTVLWWQVLQ
ncbi:hypothetical protein DAI22_12g192900 [Oryza sativa Japonica Group]|nr:hypothetical protein DAI22_12g192900 [Oryza sativa Japonica Group]